jgi:hypothetical protein
MSNPSFVYVRLVVYFFPELFVILQERGDGLLTLVLHRDALSVYLVMFKNMVFSNFFF